MKLRYRQASTEFCMSSRTGAPMLTAKQAFGADQIYYISLLILTPSRQKRGTAEFQSSRHGLGRTSKRGISDRRSISQYPVSTVRFDQDCGAASESTSELENVPEPRFGRLLNGETIADARVLHILAKRLASFFAGIPRNRSRTPSTTRISLNSIASAMHRMTDN